MGTGKARGFSILEATLALALLGVTFVAIAQMFQTGAQAQTLARERSEAVTLAQAKMEELLGLPFIQVQATSIERDLQGSSAQRFNRWVNVQSVEDHPNLKLVWVNVSWLGRLGYTTERLDTYISNHRQPPASRLVEYPSGNRVNPRLDWWRRRGLRW